MADVDVEATLRAYAREKRAQLADEGREPLVRELARLLSWLDAHERGEDPQGERVLSVNVGFRRAKIEVLRDLLDLPEA